MRLPLWLACLPSPLHHHKLHFSVSNAQQQAMKQTGKLIRLGLSMPRESPMQPKVTERVQTLLRGTARTHAVQNCQQQKRHSTTWNRDTEPANVVLHHSHICNSHARRYLLSNHCKSQSFRQVGVIAGAEVHFSVQSVLLSRHTASFAA